MDITFSAPRVLRVLTILIAGLVLASAVGTFCEVRLGTTLGGIVGFLDVNDERSIPTWYSSLGLLAAGLLLAAVAAREKSAGGRDWLAWAVLAAVFVSLSADEIAGFHEKLRRAISHKAKLAGYFKYAVVLAAGAFAAPLALLQLGFMRRLDARRRNQFILAGVIFVGGAAGVEILAGKVFHHTGDTRAPLYVILYHIEEFMEMFGVALFVSALVEQLASMPGAGAVTARFSRD